MQLFRQAGVETSYHEIDSEHGPAAPRTEWQKWSKPLAAFLAKHAAWPTGEPMSAFRSIMSAVPPGASIISADADRPHLTRM